MLKKNWQTFSKSILLFIQSVFHKSGFSKGIIAVSGGIDSAVVTSLVCDAIGRENVLVTVLPYVGINDRGLFNARLLINHLKIPEQNIFTIDIKKTVDVIISRDAKMDPIRQGNIMARVRMIYLYDLAKKNRALVLGTENKSEYLLGYFTRFGDEASDIAPIRNLYKTEIFELAKYLKLPKKILREPPTAGLWVGQTDEAELGFSYKEADKVLFLRFEKNYSIEDIVETGIERKDVEKIVSLAEKNSFKHRVPIIYKGE